MCILLVEDDAELREIVTLLLEEAGYETVGVSDGREALDYLRTHSLPRLILLDLMMPGMDGWEFRFHQRQHPRLDRVPVVVISAHHDLAHEAEILAVRGYLKKPIEPDRLLANVARYAGSRPVARQTNGESARQFTS